MSSLPSDGLRLRLLRPALWSVLAAVAIYGASVVVSDLHAVGASVAKLGVVGWVVVLGLSLVNYGLRFVRWEIYLRHLQSAIPAGRSLAYYVGGFAFTTTPGKAGEAVRSIYLKRHGVAYVDSLAAFFCERLVDLVAMILLAFVAALTFPAYRWMVVVISLIVVALLPLIHARRLHVFLARQIDRMPSGRLQTGGFRMMELLRSASGLLRSGPLYAGLGLALIAWGAEGFALHQILGALGIATPIPLAIGIYSISVLAGALSFIPGGLGSTEAVMVLLLKLVGADTPTAVAATLICRLATLWFAVMLGALVLAALDVESRTVRERPPGA